MKRLLLYIALAFAAILLVLAVGLYWLLDTTSGARFVLTTLSGAAGIDVSLQSVEGRLMDRLHLRGVHLKKAKMDATVADLALEWDLRQVASGKLLVRDLRLSGVRVQDDTPVSEKAPELRWPRVSGMVPRFTVEVDRFNVKDLYYRHLKQSPVLVTDLSSSILFKEGLLTVSDLTLLAQQGRVKGEIAMGFWRPSLRIDLSAVPAKPVQGMDLFSLQTRLVPGRDPEQVAGPIAAAGRSGGAQRLELTGQLGMTINGFNVRKLTLVRPGRRGTLTADGSMTLTKSEPLFSLVLRAKDLDLEKELKHPARVSGTLNFSGSQSRYLGSFAISNVGPGWQSATLASDFKGGRESVRLDHISGAVLDGTVAGVLDVIWSEGTRIKGTLAGRKLNPGRIAPDWRGVVNLDLAGNFYLPNQGAPRGELRGKLLESRLHGQDLHGELDGAFAGERVRVDRLLLAGRGFDLRGSGELDRRLNLLANVSDLSRLVPGTAGALRLDGWVRYRDGLFAGAAKGEGSDIAAAGARVAAVNLDAALGEGKEYPLRLDAAMRDLQVGRVKLQAARVKLDGTARRHTLAADVTSPQTEAHLALAGGLVQKTWRGELTRFYGHDTVGPWALAAPTPLAVSSSGFSIAPMVIDGLPGERVELAGRVNRRPSTGEIRGSWTGLNLARANAWLEGVQLSGGTSGNLNLRLLPGDRVIIAARADAQGTVVTEGRRITLDRFSLNVDGGESGLRAAADLLLDHGSGDAHLLFTSSRPATLSLPEQGDLRLQLANFDLALLRPEMSPDLTVDGRVAGVVSGRLMPGRRLDLRGNVAVNGGRVAWRGEGESFEGALSTAELAFNWRGDTAGATEKRGGLQLHATADATGVYTGKGERIAISRCNLRVDGDEGGTRAAFDLALDRGGALRASISSSAPASLGIPETGDFAVAWGGLDPALLRPFLPGALNLKGELAGEAKGRLLPGKRVEMTGQAEFAQGRAQWQGPSGEVNANVRRASLTFAWRGETFTMALDLALADYGKAQGQLVIPVPARLPVAVNQKGPLQGYLAGKVQERGFLTAFMPGLVQETHGNLDLDLKLAGVWSDPRITGTLQLSNAGAYLPSAGITVSGVEFLARLEGDRVLIDNFKALSGSGRLEGNLQAKLEGWQVVSYSGKINGDRFQTVYLPELQMVTSPHLALQGDGETVTINGDILIPEMLIAGPPARAVVTPSADVILEGAPQAAPGKKFPLEVQGRIHVVLGDKVKVKASGVDAQLGGGMDLVLDGLDTISSRGEIKVVKGSYKAYGMELDIVRGRLYYEDDPVNQPTLDILALRTVGDVKAGVTVGGYLRSPVVKLYSEPAMPEVDILAYVVLGHPLSSTSTDQASMVATAASSLLSFGQSESVQEQIKSRLGLSVLGLETVNPESAGLMGYKEVPVTSPTGAPTKRATTSQSLLTVGKYLTPKLYLSYGRSLVTGGSLFMLRYDIFKHWQLETQSGTESGADLYYKLEFD